jgi:hypothetical protein
VQGPADLLTRMAALNEALGKLIRCQQLGRQVPTQDLQTLDKILVQAQEVQEMCATMPGALTIEGVAAGVKPGSVCTILC